MATSTQRAGFRNKDEFRYANNLFQQQSDKIDTLQQAVDGNLVTFMLNGKEITAHT